MAEQSQSSPQATPKAEPALKPKRSGVIVADESEAIGLAIDRMVAANVGSVVAVKNNVITGILTERDVLKNWRRLADATFLTQPLAAFMTQPVRTLYLNETARAADIMLKERIRHLPVIDKDRRLVGMLSIRDVLAQEHQAQRLSPAVRAPKRSGVLHVIAPTHGLENTCQSLLPLGWKVVTHKTWPGLTNLAASADHGRTIFVDLDGLGHDDRQHVLRELLQRLTQEAPPEVFMAWTPGNQGNALETIQHVAHTAHWFAYERPLPIGGLAHDLRGLLYSEP